MPTFLQMLNLYIETKKEYILTMMQLNDLYLCMIYMKYPFCYLKAVQVHLQNSSHRYNLHTFHHIKYLHKIILVSCLIVSYIYILRGHHFVILHSTNKKLTPIKKRNI